MIGTDRICIYMHVLSVEIHWSPMGIIVFATWSYPKLRVNEPVHKTLGFVGLLENPFWETYVVLCNQWCLLAACCRWSRYSSSTEAVPRIQIRCGSGDINHGRFNNCKSYGPIAYPNRILVFTWVCTFKPSEAKSMGVSKDSTRTPIKTAFNQQKQPDSFFEGTWTRWRPKRHRAGFSCGPFLWARVGFCCFRSTGPSAVFGAE